MLLSKSHSAAKMNAARCCFLLVMICLWSSSCESSNINVKMITADRGNDIIVQCTTGKTPQDGVYMYRQQGESKPQEIFYRYKEYDVSFKQMNKSKVIVRGKLPNLNVTILNVTATDTGLYWCEFNLEDKITPGSLTFIWTDQVVEQREQTDKECPDEDISNMKMVLFVCISVFLLCSFGFFIVLLKLKWSSEKNKIRLNPPLDSVYEEMKRSNLHSQQTAQIFVNPEYQSSKQLRYP